MPEPLVAIGPSETVLLLREIRSTLQDIRSFIIAGNSIPSVALSTNAKGGIQPDVKVYNPDVREAEKQAVETMNRLRREFNGGV